MVVAVALGILAPVSGVFDLAGGFEVVKTVTYTRKKIFIKKGI